MTDCLFGCRIVRASVSAASSSDTKDGAGEEDAADASEFCYVKRAFPFPSQAPQLRTMAGPVRTVCFWACRCCAGRRHSKQTPGSQDFLGQFRRSAVKTRARVVVLRVSGYGRSKTGTANGQCGREGKRRPWAGSVRKAQCSSPWRVADSMACAVHAVPVNRGASRCGRRVGCGSLLQVTCSAGADEVSARVRVRVRVRARAGA